MKPIYCKDCRYFKLYVSGYYDCRKLISMFNKTTGLTTKSTIGFTCKALNKDNNCKYFESKKILSEFVSACPAITGIIIACIIYIIIILIWPEM